MCFCGSVPGIQIKTRGETLNTQFSRTGAFDRRYDLTCILEAFFTVLDVILGREKAPAASQQHKVTWSAFVVPE